MKNAILSVADVTARIDSGAVLLLAGSEEALGKLPRGRWIGGTSVYFLTEAGGTCDRDRIFVTEFDHATDARVVHHGTDTLPNLASGRFDNGLSAILIPAFSRAHSQFAIEAATYAGVFDQPLMGWITGTHLDDIGKVTPKIFDGATGTVHEEGAVLMHVALPEVLHADIDIVNLFTQDKSGDTITFDTDGFSASTATVNGEKVDFAAYITSKGIDTQLPLVADYAGAMINVSFQSVDTDSGRVQFYAPVMAGVEYKLAASPGDYATVFAERIAGDGGHALSCNCILNYLYGEMEGKRTGSYTGPATFGEIAYILLNQTMVHLTVKEAESVKVA